MEFLRKLKDKNLLLIIIEIIKLMIMKQYFI